MGIGTKVGQESRAWIKGADMNDNILINKCV